MRWLFAAVILFFCASCGAFSGGVGASSAAADAVATRPASANTGVSTVVCDKLPAWNAQAAQYEGEVLALVNEVRARGGRCGERDFAAVPALQANLALTCVARAYAKAMHDGAFLSHTGKDQSTLVQRVEAGGLTWTGLAENIAQGQGTPAEVMNSWMTSEGHCSNIFGSYKSLGVGFFAGYWVQDFVAP